MALKPGATLGPYADPRAHRCRWDGRGLSRARHTPRPRHRIENLGCRPLGGGESNLPIRTGGARRRCAEPSQYSRRSRSWYGKWRLLSRVRTGPRRDTVNRDRKRARTNTEVARYCGADRRRHGGGARGRRCPSRPQTGQCHDCHRRPGEDSRFRTCQTACPSRLPRARRGADRASDASPARSSARSAT